MIAVAILHSEGLHTGGCVPVMSCISCSLIPVPVVDPEGLTLIVVFLLSCTSCLLIPVPVY